PFSASGRTPHSPPVWRRMRVNGSRRVFPSRPWWPPPCTFIRRRSRDRSGSGGFVRPPDRQFPQRLHLPAAARSFRSAAAVVLPPMPETHRLVRQRSATQLSAAQGPLPLLRRPYSIAISDRRTADRGPVLCFRRRAGTNAARLQVLPAFCAPGRN